MPQNAALARKWIKFNDDGTRDDTRIESANIEVIPPMAITEVVDGAEIMQTIPAHYEDDAEIGAVFVTEQQVGTGTYEKVTKVVGQTPEQYAASINADGSFSFTPGPIPVSSTAYSTPASANAAAAIANRNSKKVG